VWAERAIPAHEPAKGERVERSTGLLLPVYERRRQVSARRVRSTACGQKGGGEPWTSGGFRRVDV